MSETKNFQAFSVQCINKIANLVNLKISANNIHIGLWIF